MPDTKPKIRMVCATCGGTNVERDAWAEWNEKTQLWELGNSTGEPVDGQ